MPYRKKYNKKYPRNYRKKYGRKHKYQKGTKAVIIRGPSALPDRIRVKLVYCDILNQAGAASAIFQYVGNDLFDPQLSAGGHQPYMFDQWAAMYARYRVYGSSLRAEIINESGTAAAQVIIYPASVPATTADKIIEAAEMPRAGMTHIIPVASRYPIHLKRYVSTRAIAGLKKGVVSTDDSYSAAVTTGPSNKWYWNIVSESIDSTTNLDLWITVKLVFYAEFYEAQVQAQS